MATTKTKTIPSKTKEEMIQLVTEVVSAETAKVKLSVARGSFREVKTKLGKIHQFLIDKKIIDGSSDSLVEDLMDGTQADDIAFDMICERLGSKHVTKIMDKLAYLALGKFYALEIRTRIRKALIIHKKEINKAFATKDWPKMRSMVKDGDSLPEIQIIEALKSRLEALKFTIPLRGDYFLKRAVFVNPSVLIDTSDVRRIR